MQEDSIQGTTLKIGEGNENDQIRVHNISNKDFTTYWGKLPFSIDAGKDRVFPRYIAIKFARELADRLIYAEADRDKKSVVTYMSKKPAYVNAILLEVVDYFGGANNRTRSTSDITEEEERTAVTLGDISVLDELGIPRTAIRTSVDDIAANFRSKTQTEKLETLNDDTPVDSIASSVHPQQTDTLIGLASVNAEPDKSDLVNKAIKLGINIPDGATSDEIRYLIAQNIGL